MPEADAAGRSVAPLEASELTEEAVLRCSSFVAPHRPPSKAAWGLDRIGAAGLSEGLLRPEAGIQLLPTTGAEQTVRDAIVASVAPGGAHERLPEVCNIRRAPREVQDARRLHPNASSL
jgi:hypothetical protein